MQAKTIPINVAQLRHACSSCSLSELCLPAGLDLQEIDRLDALVNRKRALKRGDYLYRAGSPLQSLYAVRTGFLKSCVLHDDGREQVAGFHMMGELLGMDAIGSGKHLSDAVALESSEVCEIPFGELENLSRDIPNLQQHFHRIMSREIARDYGVMLLLGSMRAEERLAAFLLNLSQRFAARGYSATQFILRMTREEIGSYLGLKLETVSRAFSHFQNEGIVAVQNKTIEIKEPERLRGLLGQCAGH
ncbi:MAG: fumarate/nitrate reduction transcriptional regulator Fnr [Betaproteobacteria bacterium]|nr:fumarate/nitrate reduction transcriptional regulator Fnr [Betaproteobacteria bacterium]